MTTDKTTLSLQILCSGLKGNFAEAVYSDERFTEVLMELATEFAVKHLPFDDDGDAQTELALMLLESVRVGTC